MSDQPILVEQHGGLGRITLNAPKALNSLSLPMARAMQQQLDAWTTDDSVAAVWLDGSGDKAFCAGGDIRAMYEAMTAHPVGERVPGCETFFTEEYRLDFTLHSYPKPVIVWGSGIVMGGGMGLMCGAAHRLVTETSRLAMPEITIGLYPDVGGSWFLNRMPNGLGLFLGLTGAQINATDAITTGLADRMVGASERDALINALASAPLATDAEECIRNVLRDFEDRAAGQRPGSQIAPHLEQIRTLTDHARVADVVDAILAVDTDDKWLSRAVGSLAKGCPMTAHLVAEQIRRSRHLSLADVFRMELVMSSRCSMQPDFREGVRALLIDKDGSPSWSHGSVAAVSEADIERHFTAPWLGESPLSQLG
ncbi:MAG: enoyl-CoA hydratase [Xanthomonadales bacterium]|nr:enoyl-CoA hydratase [Xanthomonadales bacterium]